MIVIWTHALRFHASFLIASTFLVVLGGCKPAATPNTGQNHPPDEFSLQTPGSAHHQPSTSDLANFLRRQLPANTKLLDLKNDPLVPMPGTSPGGNAWLTNVRLTFAPAEDMFEPAPTKDAQAFQSVVDELNGLIAWSRAYNQSPYVSLYPGFTVNATTLPSAQLLVVAFPKDRPLAPIYGKMTAEWQVDHWQFSVLELQLPDGDGNPRASFTGPILIQGDPVTERILATAKAAISEAKPKKAAIEGSYQADLIRATRPGTIYKGQISRDKSTMVAEVQFTEPIGNDPSLARCELRLPPSGYIYTCSAKLAKRIPIQPAALTSSEGVVATPVAVEPAPQGDLTLHYERVSEPKLNPANTFANALRGYIRSEAATGLEDVPLSLRDHHLEGKVAALDFGPGFVLSARQSP